jgi:hypothetical protein
MKNPTAEEMRDNANNCSDLASEAKDEPEKKRYQRMEATWNSLAETQDWLDGKIKPDRVPAGDKASPQSSDRGDVARRQS